MKKTMNILLALGFIATSLSVTTSVQAAACKIDLTSLDSSPTFCTLFIGPKTGNCKCSGGANMRFSSTRGSLTVNDPTCKKTADFLGCGFKITCTSVETTKKPHRRSGKVTVSRTGLNCTNTVGMGF